METGVSIVSEIAHVPAKVPGSVQAALLAAGLLPDWNIGMNTRACEWIEQRHWMYETILPDNYLKKGFSHRLSCLGLDGSGWVLVNGTKVGKFANSFIPHYFELNKALKEKGNRIQIIFDCPPSWMGQFGYTSQMTQRKPRFNYTWDWIPRLVQIGIWDGISLESSDGREIKDARWWPNGHGSQKLYEVTCELVETCEIRNWHVGFKSIEWRKCKDAPENADPGYAKSTANLFSCRESTGSR